MGTGTTNANGMQVRFSARSILPQQQQCIPDQIAPSFAGKFVSGSFVSMWIDVDISKFLNFFLFFSFLFTPGPFDSNDFGLRGGTD